jgi:hypothetical protein
MRQASLEMLVPLYQTTRCHVLEDHSLDTDSCEDFKVYNNSYIIVAFIHNLIFNNVTYGTGFPEELQNFHCGML